MSRKVTILGFYSHSNIGDEAYKITFPKLFPDYDLHFTDKLNKSETCPVILGGGNVINDYFLKELATYKGKKYAFSVDGKPCSGFELIVSRSKPEEYCYLPDFAFLLEPNRKRGKQLIADYFKGSELYEKVVIVVLNGYLVTRESTLFRDYVTFENVCNNLAHLIDNTDASFLFVAFGHGFPFDDRIANSILYSRCKFWKKNVLLFGDLAIQDTLDIISAADAAICTRLHACIFSVIGGTPFIDICHHDKTRFFVESIDKSNWSVDYWRFNYENIKSLLESHLHNPCLRADLGIIALQNKIQILSFTFPKLCV